MKARATEVLAASLATAMQHQQVEQLHALLRKLRRYQSKRLDLERQITRRENGFLGSFVQASDHYLACIYDKITRIDTELGETSQGRQDGMIARLEELHAYYRQLTANQDLNIALLGGTIAQSLPHKLRTEDLLDPRLADENYELQRCYSAIIAHNRQKYALLASNSAKLRVQLLQIQDLSRAVEQDDHQLCIAQQLLQKYERCAHSLAGSLHGVEHLGAKLVTLKGTATQLQTNLCYLEADILEVKELGKDAERLMMGGYCLEYKYIAHYKKISKALREAHAKYAKPQFYQQQAAIFQFSRYKDAVLQAQLGLLALVKRCNSFTSFCREQAQNEAAVSLSERVMRQHAELSQETDATEARAPLSWLSAVSAGLDKLA